MKIRNKLFFLIGVFFIFFSCGALCSDKYDCAVKYVKKSGLNLISAHKGASGKLLIYIQDAHCNYPAQKELSSMVEKLYRGGLFEVTAVEGSSGEIDTSVFSSFPVDSVRRKIADDLLKSGVISGEEYFSISGSTVLKIWGVDDKTLYLRNIEAFSRYFEIRGDCMPALMELSSELKKLKETRYNSSLLEFDRLYSQFCGAVFELDKFIARTLEICDESAQFLEKYPDIIQVRAILNTQREFDSSVLNIQTKQIIDRISEKSTPQDVQKIKKLVAAHISGKTDTLEFYAALIEKLRRLNIDCEIYPAVLQYIGLLKDIRNVDSSKVYRSAELFAGEVYGCLVKSDMEKKIYEASSIYGELEKLCSLSLTRDEYDSLAKPLEGILTRFESVYNGLSDIKMEDSALNPIRKLVENNLLFYRIAKERDRAIFNNTLSLLDREKAGSALIIAGGFHTAEITANCRSNDISCLVLSPKNAGTNDFGKYASVLLRSNLDYTGSEVLNTNLRASSFFAGESFDSISRINEFRNRFIFRAVMESLADFSYAEIHDILRDWRSGFMQAVSVKHPAGSQEYINAVSLFDYAVTNVFSFENLRIDRANKVLVLKVMGETIELSKQAGEALRIKTVPARTGQDYLEDVVKLSQTPIRLANTDVYISSWTIVDANSPYKGHGDAHYSVKYIEALNKRGVQPIVILPADQAQMKATLAKYSSAIKGLSLKVRFAKLDNGSKMIEVDLKGTQIGQIVPNISRKPAVLGLYSKIDAQADERTALLNLWFATQSAGRVTPVFIKIPTAGTVAKQWDRLDEITVYFNPMPPDFTKPNAIEAGFAMDEELLSLIKKLKSSGKNRFRETIMQDLDMISSGRITQSINSLQNIEPLDFTAYNWSFRYLTEKTDSELASFMKAVSQSADPQVVFTFYGDKSDLDKKHKEFLKKNFSFIDLQQINNDNILSASRVVVINLPALDSRLFKSLMSVADCAVLSGENSLVEGLVLNKFGMGPAILFKPAMQEHFSIIENAMLAKGRTAFLDKLKSYAMPGLEQDEDYFSAWQAGSALNSTERFIHDIMFNPNANGLLRSLSADMVLPQNGLNTLTDIIADIDKNMPRPAIIARHSYPVKQSAVELINIFMLSKTFDPKSELSQKEFLDKFVKGFVHRFILSSAQSRIESGQILSKLDEFLRVLVKTYKDRLEQTGAVNVQYLADNLKRIIETYFSTIEIVGTGHLFIPSAEDSGIEYYYLDWQPFIPTMRNYNIPTIRSQKISVEDKNRLANDIKQAQIVKNIFGLIDMSDILKSWARKRTDASLSRLIPHYETRIIPFYTQAPEQTEFILDTASFIALDYARELVDKHRAKLKELLYAVADLESFYKYCRYLKEKGDAVFEKSEVYAGLMELKKELEFDSSDMYTQFFRYQSNWKTPLEDYLDGLIAHKIAEDDFSISAKSIGSATGKEPYSIASLIEKALYKAGSKLFADISNPKDKEKAVQNWIDRWRINVYAVEHVLSRFVAMRQGIYVLSPDEQFFFDLNAEYADMFSDTATYEKNECVAVKDRLKRWVKPVYCDVETQAARLTGIKSEIVFALNIFPYLTTAKESVHAAMMSSFSPQYKGYLAFNISFENKLETLDMINGQPLCVPAQKDPCAGTIVTVAMQEGIDNIAELAKIFGVTPEYITEILSSQIEIDSFQSANSKIYANLAQRAVDQFVDESSFKLSSGLNQQWFINEKVRQLVKNMAMKLNLLGVPPKFIERHLMQLKRRIEASYKSRLDTLNQAQGGIAYKSFSDKIDRFFAQVTVGADGSLFMESEFMQYPMFEHIYVDWNEFSVKPETEGQPQIKTELVAPSVKQRLIAAMSDVMHIREIFDDLKFEIHPVAVKLTDLLPYYNGSERQRNILDNGVALAVLDQFRELVKKYGAVLIEKYGRADLSALRAYLLDISLKKVSQDTALAADLISIRKLLRDTQFSDTAIKNGATQVFRDHVTDWVEALESHLYDIIAQKTVSGDYTLNLRSVASSIGKEAYTISAITEKMLLKYARDTVFSAITDETEKNKLAEKWVDIWDVKVYALDMNLFRLAQSHIGFYKLFDQNIEWYYPSKHPEYLRMFSGSRKTDLMTLVKVNDRYRRWIIPAYCDFGANLDPVISNPCEVTLARYIFMYLPKDVQEKLAQAIVQSSNPDYKSFIGFNERSIFKPYLKSLAEAHGIMEPAHKPDVDKLVKYAVNTGLYSSSDLAKMVGISETDLKEILVSNTGNSEFAEGIFTAQAEQIVTRAMNHVFNPVSDNGQIEFIDIYIAGKLPELVLNLHLLGLDADNISRQIRIFFKDIATAYKKSLDKTKVADSTVAYETFMSKLKDYADSVAVKKGHLFLPESFGQTGRFTHAYLDFGYFGIDKNKYGEPQIKQETVPSRAKERMIADISDSEPIARLLEEIGYELDYSKFTSSEVPPTYIKTVAQKESLKYDVAFILLDYFRNMVRRYSDQITRIYGEPNIANLITYFNDSQNKKVPENRGLKNDFARLLSILVNNKNTNIFNGEATTIGLTRFFRDTERGWVASLENYLRSLIEHKIAKGDYSLTLRSIGSSIGKEAYSLASITQNALREYAADKLYKDISDPNERYGLVEKWIDNWDVRVLALDLSLHRLAYATEGVYLVKRDEMQFLDSMTQYKPMFSQIAPQGAKFLKYESLAEVSPRLKRWVEPVYCNLDDDMSPLSNNPAEVSFAMTVFMYLKNPADVIKTIVDSANPDYKGYFGFNEDKTVKDKLKDIGYPPADDHVLSPQNMPDLSFVYKMIAEGAITSLASASEYLGIPARKLGKVLDGKETYRSAGPDFYADYAQKLINGFYEGSQSGFADITAQTEFINTAVRDFMIDFVFRFSLIKTDAKVIRHELDRLSVQLNTAYLERLRKLNIPAYGEISKKFEYNLNALTASFEIAGYGATCFCRSNITARFYTLTITRIPVLSSLPKPTGTNRF